VRVPPVVTCLIYHLCNNKLQQHGIMHGNNIEDNRVSICMPNWNNATAPTDYCHISESRLWTLDLWTRLCTVDLWTCGQWTCGVSDS